MTTHHVTPLHIAGNTTDSQRQLLQDTLAEAMQRVYRTALKQLDRQSAGLVLELREKLKAEVASSAVKIMQRLTLSDKYKDEETVSRREYPAAYRVRPIEAQVTELRRIFPQLGGCPERIGRHPLPEGAEAWFAIPRWQALGTTYNEALEKVVSALAARRKLSNRIVSRMDAVFLRQNERTKLAESILADQQPGSDILVIAAQAGLLHRGCSARRARVVMAGNEFGLGAFSLGCILLTHPERLSHLDTLMMDCSGDEYSLRGDGIFDRVPLYDYDLGGLEFSIFYEDRARNLWGTPSGFLFQMPAGKTHLLELVAAQPGIPVRRAVRL